MTPVTERGGDTVGKQVCAGEKSGTEEQDGLSDRKLCDWCI